MRRGRTFFILAFVLILALVAILVLYRIVIQPPAPPETTPTVPPVAIVYITQNIPKGTTLESGMLTTWPWPQDSVTPSMFMENELDQVIGRVAKYDLQADMPLLETMLLDPNEQLEEAGSPWALNIPPGMVAVSIPINRLSALAYAPRPGDHVNVIASVMFLDVDTDFQTSMPNYTGLVVASGPPDAETGAQLPLTVGVSSLSPGGSVDPETGQPLPPSGLTPGIFGKVVIDPVLGQAMLLVPSEGQRPRYVSHMLLQDVVVLRMGEFPLAGTDTGVTPAEGAEATPVPAAEETQGEPAPAPALPDVVTLIVRPQDAVTINYLMIAQTQSAAQLSLVLRNASDTSRENILPVTLQFLMEQYQIPVPARLPYSLNPRIDVLVPPVAPVPTAQP